MPQILDVTANENAHYKRNELELCIYIVMSQYKNKLHNENWRKNEARRGINPLMSHTIQT